MSSARIISNFFLDGAKIIFGSLVVGAFLPGAIPHEFPWSAFLVGIIMTVAFLAIAHMAGRKADVLP